jgi:hypothetical protein
VRAIASLTFGVVLCSAVSVCATPAPPFRWAQLIGGPAAESGYNVVNDPEENFYVTGSQWSSTVAFGSNTAVNAGGAEDIFIAKFNKHGSNLWVQTAGGTGYDEGHAVSLDSNGNVYITGSVTFSAPDVFFGPTNFIVRGIQDGFVAKYDASGAFRWVRQIAGTNGQAEGWCVANHGTNLYVAGRAEGSVDLGGIVLTRGIFLAKYDDNGNLLAGWSLGDGYVEELCVDANGNCYVSGFFMEGTFSTGELSLTRTGAYADGFVLKIDGGGNPQWIKQHTGAVWGVCRAKHVLPNGDLIILGILANGTPAAFDGVAVTNIFLACVTSTGSNRWVRSLLFTNGEIFGLSMDSVGNFLIHGDIAAGGAVIGDSFYTNSARVSAAVVIKLDPFANVRWVKTVNPSPAVTNRYSTFWSLDVTASDAVVAIGRASTDVSADSGTATNHGSSDLLLARIDPDPPHLGIGVSGMNTFISWGTNQPGFSLEYRISMQDEWLPFSSEIVRVGSFFVATNTVSAGQKFFRLRSNE